MKTYLALAAVSVCLASFGQTNTITFTNQFGTLVSNAVAWKIAENKIEYLIPDGAGAGTENLARLPADIRAKFNYDAEKAEALDQHETLKRIEQKEQQEKRDEAARVQADLERDRKEVEQTCRAIAGTVIQKVPHKTLDDGAGVPAGLLIDCGQNTVGVYDKRTGATTYAKQPYASGTILLIDYPKYDEVVDGDFVEATGYACGEFDYTTVMGGTKSVRRFTCDKDVALRAHMAQEIIDTLKARHEWQEPVP